MESDKMTITEFDKSITANRKALGAQLALLDQNLEATDDLNAAVAAEAVSKLALAIMRDAISNERANGRTWQQIGNNLGTSRQSAHERFGKASASTPRQFAVVVERQTAHEADARVIISHTYNAECASCGWATLPDWKHGAPGRASDQRDEHNRTEHGTDAGAA